jgi:hypothetical protein
MRSVATACLSALLAALIAGAAWALVFSVFIDVPSAYPQNWAAMPREAQDQWLFAHSVKVSGIAALWRIIVNTGEYAAPLFGFLGLLFLCALGALGINALLRRRAP